MMVYQKEIASHFNRIIHENTDRYGKRHALVWMSAMDSVSGQYPASMRSLDLQDAEQDHMPPGCRLLAGKRVYRNIDAPGGFSIYWDQPHIKAAWDFASRTENDPLKEAVCAYIRFFLENCVAKNGMFLWGNHYYYDAFADQNCYFKANEVPQPVNLEQETGELHELRPIVPNYDLFYRLDSEKTVRYLTQIGTQHMVDEAEGIFNRHADGQFGCAFLEAGGILCESLCWLYQKTMDAAFLEKAIKIAAFSAKNHGESGLVINNPTVGRWDKHTSTTEVGFWAGCLLQCYAYTHDERFIHLAAPGVKSYLKYGWDDRAEKFFGRLDVKTGLPVPDPRETLYQPGYYADIWSYIFPGHDYPIQFAESLVTLYKLTGDAIYKQGLHS